VIDQKIAFLGGGNMAEALIKGMLAAGVANANQMLVMDVSADRLAHLQKTFGIVVSQGNKDAVTRAGIILLCVKPQVMEQVLKEISDVAGKDKLVISIAAGVTVARIEKALADGTRVIRVMPNTPALVLSGAAGIAAGSTSTASDMMTAQQIFGAVGRAVVVEEKLMDAVTGLSGSGPAYVFTIIEALADAGVKAGIPRELALELSAQTVYGAAKMVLETHEHPGKLRDKVTSPGGTTLEGLHALEKGKLRETLLHAVEAATARSKELGK
jgi:pyrroline-5-carboxylate reductase